MNKNKKTELVKLIEHKLLNAKKYPVELRIAKYLYEIGITEEIFVNEIRNSLGSPSPMVLSIQNYVRDIERGQVLFDLSGQISCKVSDIPDIEDPL